MREIVEVEKLARSRTVQSVPWGTELKALLKFAEDRVALL